MPKTIFTSFEISYFFMSLLWDLLNYCLYYYYLCNSHSIFGEICVTWNHSLSVILWILMEELGLGMANHHVSLTIRREYPSHRVSHSLRLVLLEQERSHRERKATCSVCCLVERKKERGWWDMSPNLPTKMVQSPREGERAVDRW